MISMKLARLVLISYVHFTICHKIMLLACNNHKLIEVYVNGCFTPMINHTQRLIELVNKFANYLLLNSFFLLLFLNMHNYS